MKVLISNILLSLVTLVLFGFVYPLMVIGIAMLMPVQSKGLPLYQDKKLVGFENIGQDFHSTQYFWGRPSTVDYNAAATGGSNLSNDNPKYMEIIQQRADTLLKYHPEWKKSSIPIELLTASGSGLDPHISQKAALMQVKRIAKERGIEENKLNAWVESHTVHALFGVLGPDNIVNVLKLNLALDKISKK